jgi:hypothetical protein
MIAMPSDKDDEEVELMDDFVDAKSPVKEVHVHGGGGGTSGGSIGGGGPSWTAVDTTTPEEEEESSSPLAGPTHFAACQSGHPPLNQEWVGPTRMGPSAYDDARADADTHNAQNPGHEAAVI